MKIPEHIQKIMDKPSILPQVEKEIKEGQEEMRKLMEQSRKDLDRMLL